VSPGLARYMRRPTEVEALPLLTPRDMHVAEMWMGGHGVEAAHRHPALASRGLLVPAGPPGVFTVARLGQWLVRDVELGDFAVCEDDAFRAVHTPHLADALAALPDAQEASR
jgi:hypothetical protein